jgi:hypothetical protein
VQGPLFEQTLKALALDMFHYVVSSAALFWDHRLWEETGPQPLGVPGLFDEKIEQPLIICGLLGWKL